ncbi:MAG: tetratricopeptide repeat protein [Planctomycetes bacterium]|nr:tetratricopeptide repeat protein [Planctomycetota bacterium]
MALRRASSMAHLALLALAAAVFAGNADAAALIKRFFGTQSENKIADVWIGETWPNTLREICKAGNFPRTKIRVPDTKPDIELVEIRDVKNDNKTLVVHLLLRIDENEKGEPEYRVDATPHDAKIENWRLRYLVDCSDVSRNDDDAFAVAFAVWLYAQKDAKEPDLPAQLARRVLAVVHNRNEAARVDIEDYIIEREKLKNVKSGDFVIAPVLDMYMEGETMFSVERETLLTKAQQVMAARKLENDAENKLFEITDSLGDYGKPAASRKRLPKKFLVLIQWDIKQYRVRYKDTKCLAREGKTLDAMDKSIVDDWAAIAAARADADRAKTNDKKAEALEPVLTLDPHDVRLARDCAGFWVEHAEIQEDGKNCKLVEGADRARPIYERILKLRPGNTAYMYNLARCHQVKREDRAKELYREIIRLDGKNSERGKKADKMLENMGEK